MAYYQIALRSGTDINSAADINQLRLNTDAILGSEAILGPSVALEDKADKANTPTMSANAGATDEIILSAGANKTQKTSSKTFEDTPSNATNKVLTSQWAYRQSTQDVNWFKEAKITTSVNLTSGYTSGTWKHCTGLSLSLEAGTWEVYYSVNLYTNRTTITTRENGITISTANNTSGLDDLRLIYYETAASLDMIQTFQAKKIITVGSTTTYYLNCYNNGGGAFGQLQVYAASNNPYGNSYFNAKRLY